MLWSTSRFCSHGAGKIAATVSAVIESVIIMPCTSLLELNYLSSRDQEQLAAWATALPSQEQSFVHQTVEYGAIHHQDATAVHAWDGNLSYFKLDQMTRRLAAHIATLGVGPEVMVPLLFEKSCWMIVAMTAVLRAGAACVPLDPSQPQTRQEAILREVNATILLTSKQHTGSLSNIVCKELTVDGTLISQILDAPEFQPPVFTPANAAFIMFTSGSTGIPKGIIQEHAQMYTSLKAHSEIMGLNQDSRVYQFASYIFDVSVSDIFGAFMHGACVCIPSDSDRVNDLERSIARLNASHICLTPTVARSLNPSSLPNLKTLTLGGEKLTNDLVKTWSSCVHLINIYGVTECNVWCAMQPNVLYGSKPENIGRGVGATLWVVDRDNHNLLAPVGGVGELLVEGPILARGYLKNAARTAEAFVEPPQWLKEIRGTDHCSRLYKTGDLVRYQLDGTILFLKRKDKQVKLHGQRIELEEIEHHLLTAFGNQGDVVVEVVTPEGEDVSSSLLVAFICFKDMPDREESQFNDVLNLAMSEDQKSYVVHLEIDLSTILPRYIVPTHFIPVSRIPKTISGKTDHKMLQEVFSQFSMEQMQNFTSATNTPSNDMERRLALAWAKLLRLDVKKITTSDHFFKAGGDSIRAMELVSMARNVGLVLTVADIIKYPRLGAMSQRLDYLQAEDSLDVEPFSLLTPEFSDVMITEAIAQYEIVREDIEDMFPCSPLQEGLIALSEKRYGAYITHDIYEIANCVDIGRFQKAWETTVKAHSILRTRIIHVGDKGLFQVVLKSRIHWRYFSSHMKLIENSHEKPGMGPGGDLSQYAIIDQEEDTQPRLFVWSVHHAIFDGWSQPLLLQALERAYATLSDPQNSSNRTFDPPPAYNRFIKFTSEIDVALSEKFWNNYLIDMTAPAFPSLPYSGYEPVPSKTLLHDITLKRERPPQITIPTMIELAWMMIVSAHTGSDDVVIGVTVSGRNAPVDGILEMTGPTFATIPRRIRLNRTQKVLQALNHLQEQSTMMIPFEQTGLRRIRGFGLDSCMACDFQNLLIIQPVAEEEISNVFSSSHKQKNLLGVFNTYALMIECSLTLEGVSVVASFDEQVISSMRVRRIVKQFEQVLLLINAEVPGMTIGSIDMISGDDVKDIKTWNSVVPETVNVCIHDLITDANRADPEKEVICSWDGTLTFAQLNDLSLRLAHRLVSLGVKTEDLIPLCFEKSMWAIVALFAVLKCGAAFTLMNDVQPPERLRHMVQQVNARVVLTSAKQAKNFSDAEITIVVVDAGIAMLASPKCWSIQPSPSSAAFAVFTSGSTGTPKCVVVEHKAFSTSALAHGLSERLTRSSRVLQFADFAFDVAISDILTTLVFGGCVCIPSENQRVDDLTMFINDMAVTDAFLTPTVARLLKPTEIPGLKTLKLGGEALSREDLLLWSNSVHLINSYGVAECSVRSAYKGAVSCNDHPSNIGFSVGCACWIVNTHDHNFLAPIGAIGELVIEGPSLARGYFNDPIKTAGSFVECPPWLSHFRSKPHTRLYRTGDLVRYDDNGSMIFEGRKDSQIKLRGQRVELGEIEYQLHRLVPDTNYVVCDIIGSVASSVAHKLVAFYCDASILPMRGEANEIILLPPGEQQISHEFHNLETRLRDILPAYMIPSFFLPVRYLPQTATGKINRRKLRNVVQGLTLEKLRAYTLISPEKGQLSSPMEIQLAIMWCQILSPINDENIGPDDNFFRLGGDSVLAMHLAALARRKGYSLGVASIFQKPKLAAQAKAVQLLPKTEAGVDRTHALNAPFSLLAELDQQLGNVNTVRNELANKLHLKIEVIENAYPCTPLQEGLMALSIKQPGAYVSQHIFDLPIGIDLACFRGAWEMIVRKNAILRTVIWQHSSGNSLQVVLGDMDISWLKPTSLDDYLPRDHVIPMNYGDRLARYALVQQKSDSGQFTFVWTAHHAIYDGQSLALLLRQVAMAYRQQPLERTLPFVHFLSDILFRDRMAAERYWSKYLEGAVHVPFLPPPLKTLQQKRKTVMANLSLAWLPSDYTLPTVIRAAWAIIVSKYSMSQDIVFGSTLAGRNSQLGGLEDMIGPTITTVPIRAHLREDDTVASLMSRLQDESSTMIPFEHFGLQNIGKISPVIQRLCQFQNLLVIHPMQDAISEIHDVLGHLRDTEYSGDFLTNPLVLECSIVEGGIELKANFESAIINTIQAQRLLIQFKSVLSQLCFPEIETKPLKDITWISHEDEAQIMEWNNTMPERSMTCIHEAIQHRSVDNPCAEAVYAWDGKLTYAELDYLSSSVSNHLLALGLQNEEYVPFCFEKSKWAVVAQLGILKAGGACVPLDPAHPLDRKKVIALKTHARVILTSKFVAPSLENVVRNLVVVDESLILKSTLQDHSQPRVSPNSPAFIMFTSGSTGTPKGIVIEHATTYSSARNHGVAMRLSSQSRVFQFSSYAFDVAVFDIFTTLLFGGCVCIPSDSDRTNMKTIAGVASDMRINWALLTPSYVRLLRPNDFPSLRTLLMCGEPVPQDLIHSWMGKVSLLNAYGPTESSACVVGEIHENTPPGTIGKAVGGLSWR